MYPPPPPSTPSPPPPPPPPHPPQPMHNNEFYIHVFPVLMHEVGHEIRDALVGDVAAEYHVSKKWEGRVY